MKPTTLMAAFGLALTLTAPQLARAEATLSTDPEALQDPAVSGPVLPEKPEPAPTEQRSVSFGRQVGAVPLEIAGLAVGLAATRMGSLKHSDGFDFGSEGWFGRNTHSLGSDKLVHAWSAYVIGDFLTSAIRHKAGNPSGAQITGGLLAFGLTMYAETFDGFGAKVAKEDIVANFAGAGFSVLRNSIPGMKEKIDFRMQYLPSGNVSGFHPLRDYSGQKYLLAATLSGFEGTRDTPLRFVELHAGYYARGFTAEERAEGKKLRRELFVGIGLNLKELLFRSPGSLPERWIGSTLDYIQVPYTALNTQ